MRAGRGRLDGGAQASAERPREAGARGWPAGAARVVGAWARPRVPAAPGRSGEAPGCGRASRGAGPAGAGGGSTRAAPAFPPGGARVRARPAGPGGSPAGEGLRREGRVPLPA